MFKLNKNSDFLKTNIFDYKQLLNVKQCLMECDEFKNIEDFNIIEIPEVQREIIKLSKSDEFSFGNKY